MNTPQGAARPVSAAVDCAVSLHGFAAVPARLVADRSISHTELRLLLALAAHAGPEQECWPGVERLAAIVNLTGRQVRRVLRSLERSGYVQVFKRERQDGTQTSNLYKLRFSRWDESGNSDADTHPGGRQITEEDPDKNVRASGAECQGPPDTIMSAPIIEDEPLQTNQEQTPPTPLAGEGVLTNPLPFDLTRRMTRAERKRIENLETAHGTSARCRICGGNFAALHDYFLSGRLSRYGGQLVTGVTVIKRDGAIRGYAHNHCTGHAPTVYEITAVSNPGAPWAQPLEKVKS